MKRPTIEITDIHGKNYGVCDVTEIGWTPNGDLVTAKVDFMGDYRDLMVMYDIDCTGTFINARGNLKGKLIFD
jgi:hypothetical protein